MNDAGFHEILPILQFCIVLLIFPVYAVAVCAIIDRNG